MTATRSAVSAITPMSCVTSITAVPWSRHRRFSSWMICAWIETSSAVVGSSAMISLGLRRQRERDDHALAHAARELVRVVVDAPRGRRDADLLEQRDRAARARGLAHREVRANRLDDLAADRVERIERGERVLEHRADLAAADPAHLRVRQAVDAPAVEADLAAGDAARRVDEPDDRRPGDRLAGAGLADHAEHLAARDLEADVVDGDQRAPDASGTRRAGARRRAAASPVHPARIRSRCPGCIRAIVSTWSTTGVKSDESGCRGTGRSRSSACTARR